MINDNIDNEFFIIDSNNLGNINTKLYGYLVSSDVLFDDDVVESTIKVSNGAYIFIKDTSDTISIYQDFNGSYNLYLFEYEDYFALSNSFLKLEEYLKEQYEFSLNENYAKSFLSTISSSYAYDETLINEIKILPRNVKVKINKSTKQISIEKINNKTIELSSFEAMEYLDNWFDNWVTIFRNLKNKTNNISVDLDGSLSSLVILAIILKANINLENIVFNTKNSYNNYENINISSKISDIYNINLNTALNVNMKEFGNIQTPVDNSFYTKLGLSKEINFENSYYEEPTYLITNDEMTYSSYINDTLEQYLETEVSRSEKYSNKFKEIIQKYLFENINKVQKDNKIFDFHSLELTQKFFQDTKNRNHMGKHCVESFLVNKIILNPLSDQRLSQINTTNYDQNILYILLITRYFNDLTEFVQQNFSIDVETVKIAQKLNNIKKYEQKTLELVSGPNIELNNNHKSYNNKINETQHFIEKIFFSNAFKYEFLKYFPKETYDYILDTYYETHNAYLGDIYAAMGIMKVLTDIEYIRNRKYRTEFDWLKNYVLYNNYEQNDEKPVNLLLTKYNTIRMDIKNNGILSNNIHFLNNTDNFRLTNPTWFTNESGIGTCLFSEKSELNIEFKCINDGQLNIELRTMDIKDRNNKRFPIYVDILSFKVDDKEQLKENTLVQHDKPIKFTKEVFDSEIIKISLKWQPFSNLSKYID